MKDSEDAFEDKVWALLSSHSLPENDIREATKVLNECIIPKMMGVLKNLGADMITAEEIAKQAVDRSARMITRFDRSRARLSTWMTKIAINLLHEKHRKGLIPSQKTTSLDSVPASNVSELPSVDSTFQTDCSNGDSEFVKKVKSVLPLLSDEDKTLISLELNGDNKESYMVKYSISDVTYRQRKTRALQRLRELVLVNEVIR